MSQKMILIINCVIQFLFIRLVRFRQTDLDQSFVDHYILAFPALPFTGFGKRHVIPKKPKLVLLKSVRHYSSILGTQLLETFSFEKNICRSKGAAQTKADRLIKSAFASLGDTLFKHISYYVKEMNQDFIVEAWLNSTDLGFIEYSKFLQFKHEQKLALEYQFIDWLLGPREIRNRLAQERFQAKRYAAAMKAKQRKSKEN